MAINRDIDYVKRNRLTHSGANKVDTFTGRVMEDKAPNSRIITVFIKDLLPYYAGKLEKKNIKYKVGGGTYQSQIEVTNCYEAEWLGDDSNRRFPPDVKKNEQVEVLFYADQDKIYWRSLGRDDDKRRTERIEWNAADTPEGPAPINKENSYSISMDTQDEQQINIQTSKTAGEPFAYVIKINAKDGSVHISDDANNEYVMESSVPRIYMRNNQGAFLEIAKKNVTIIAPEDFLLKVGRQAVWDVPALKMMNTNGAGVTVWECAEILFKGNSAIIDCSCIGLKGNVEASNIVSGAHYATSYATVSGGAMARARNLSRSASNIKSPINTYNAPSINEFVGLATRANNSPNVNGGFSSNRHCAAWEDISDAIFRICEDLEKIDGHVGYGNQANAIREAATSSEMSKNTGQ